MTWALAAGDLLAHYRVLSPLGSGAMAQVYLAEDIRLGRRLALKVLSPRWLRDDERLQRFQREARAISALNHPNILTVYDIGDAAGVQFLATEYIDGVTLRKTLERGRLDVRQAVSIGIQIAQAITAAHDAGVIHRDLKPENVMVRADGYVKVLDFGLAKLAGMEPFGVNPDAETQLLETRDCVVMGTFSYMAPEQARGGDIDPRADLFALGVLLYEMLTGAAPFGGPTAADVVGAVLFHDPDPLTHVVDLPPELERIVMTALRKDRGERYQTGAQLLQELTALERALASGSEVTHSGGTTLIRAALGSIPGTEPATIPRRRRGRVIDSLAAHTARQSLFRAAGLRRGGEGVRQGDDHQSLVLSAVQPAWLCLSLPRQAGRRRGRVQEVRAADSRRSESARLLRRAADEAGTVRRVSQGLRKGPVAGSQLRRVLGRDPRVLYLAALAFRESGDARQAAAFARKAAEFNGLSFNYAYVRSKAAAMTGPTNQ